ncbi:unnamed protein product [Musa hybrid cultivar]
MNASQLPGDAEECSSCESGWTKYLSSPAHDDDDSEVESVVGDAGEDTGHENKESDDDSMASDASTGLIQSKDSDGMVHSKCNDANDDDDDDDDDGFRNKKQTQCSSHSNKQFCKVEEARSEREDFAALHSNSKARKKKLK